MQGTAIVVVNGVTAKQIDQKSVEFRHSDPGSTFSRKLCMERNNDVSLSHHSKYLNHRFLWLGIISGHESVILTSAQERAVYVGIGETDVSRVLVETDRQRWMTVLILLDQFTGLVG